MSAQEVGNETINHEIQWEVDRKEGASTFNFINFCYIRIFISVSYCNFKIF